jgi:homocitrate synthase
MSLVHCAIVESTLREGEQFCQSWFSADDREEIARALDAFGVDYIEVTSPCASPQSQQDCRRLAQLGLRAKVLTHIRCRLEDARLALDAGVDGINLFMGTSPILRQYSHGYTLTELVDQAVQVIGWIHSQSPQTELRFSTEDAFRSDLQELLKIYQAIQNLGMVHRFGIADTVGIATPHQVYQLVRHLRQQGCQQIEFHGHNDTGCAIANSYAALEAGATHIDTTVLGIGERNGITPLAGLIARLYILDPEGLAQKYCLPQLLPLHQLVAAKVGIPIPFNHCIVGAAAFSHKAGPHTNAMLKHPNTYEVINPDDFGLTRSLLTNHRLTGRHAISHRALQLGLSFNQTQIQSVTQMIKALADRQVLTPEMVDQILTASLTPELKQQETVNSDGQSY